MNMLTWLHASLFGSSNETMLDMARNLSIACPFPFLLGCVRARGLRKPHVIVVSLVGLVLAGLVIQSYASRAYRPRPLVFDGDSTKLTRTCVVPTLDTPIEPNKNIIWCASFQAAWKSLQDDLVKESVQLADAADMCARLNQSPAPEVPEGTLYAAAGRAREGIVDTIRREQANRFPGSARPDFPNVEGDDLVAYGYLESSFKFPIPYSDATSPETFTDSSGNKTGIRVFGVRSDDDPASRSVRKQIDVLVHPGAVKDRPDDFVVDLCRDSKDTQVVFASVPVGPSLKETLATVDADIASAHPSGDAHGALGGDKLVLVPELVYRISHRFSPLIGRRFLNAGFTDLLLTDAQQDTMFRLDRSGMELKSRTLIAARSAVAKRPPRLMIGDRPFLVYLKKRGAALPYFAMWVDNDELLMKWEKTTR